MAEASGEAEADADAAADRLEAALERIAGLASRSAPATVTQSALPAMPAVATPLAEMAELADRLDALIVTLRQALDGPAA